MYIRRADGGLRYYDARGIDVESGKEDQIAIDDSGLDVDLLYII